MTTRPPGRSDLSEWFQAASPTVSITASTRSGSLAPVSNAWSAPSEAAHSRFASSREVTQTRLPSALPRSTRAVATPPAAPCTRIVSPGSVPDFVAIMR